MVLAQLSLDPAVKAAILKVKRSRDDDDDAELAESPSAKSVKTTDDTDVLLAETMETKGSIGSAPKTDASSDSDS